MAAAPPALPFELVEEILLRLPPDEPAWILRASLVCKAWGCAFSHPSFRRRLHELHGTPPVLGFIPNWVPAIGFFHFPAERYPSFIPTTASAFSLAAPERRFWRPLDCRHGRAVFISDDGDAPHLLLLWEPITGSQRRVPVPTAFESMSEDVEWDLSAAVFCAADGCDHHGCHGGPFRVVFVFTVDKGTDDDDGESYVTSACVYSSETGMWGELASVHCDFKMNFEESSSVLVGRSQPYFMSNGGVILEYDLESNNLTVIDRPNCDFEEEFNIMLAEDGRLGGLGLIPRDLDRHLKLWSREVRDGTDARWILSRIIYLHNLLPIDALMYAFCLRVVGFAEGANVIFIDTHAGLFTIELHSERVRKVLDGRDRRPLLPFVSFYTPVPQNKHQDQLLSITGEEERGEKEKTVAQAQKFYENGSNSIKVGTSSTPSNVSAMSCITVARVPPCGDTAPESAAMGAVLYKAQEVTDPTNDESVKNSVTDNTDDTGNLIGGSNVDDASDSDKGD